MYVNMKSFFVVSVLFSSVLITQVQGIPNDSPPPSYCNTGTQQCCDQVTAFLPSLYPDPLFFFSFTDVFILFL
ncbi:hypothetical protein C8Q75DRAFT_493237 [Abortiporus biennis]|nr:hypothetical protein C8Q75DRAFT_493237 [Abortiporus biennis]